MTLDVVIATYMPEGIERVAEMELTPIPNVNYIVSWQNHQNHKIPEKLLREDIHIHRLDETGLSRNRNNALSHSKAEIIYLADDDIKIMPGALAAIMKRFEEYPDTEMATFKMKETGLKTYPEGVMELGFYLPKNYNIGTCQMAFRRRIFPGIKFNPEFGLGSGKFELGEDELFHLACRKHGLKCRFFPDVVASHPQDATGTKKITNPKVVQAMGVLITKSYPRSFLLRIPFKSWRLRKNKRSGFLFALINLYIGSLKSVRVKI